MQSAGAIDRLPDGAAAPNVAMATVQINGNGRERESSLFIIVGS